MHIIQLVLVQHSMLHKSIKQIVVLDSVKDYILS